MTFRLVSVSLLLVALVACGDDGGLRSSMLPAKAIGVSAENRGITLNRTRSLAAFTGKMLEDQELASRLVVVEQVYSELEHVSVGNVERAPEPRIDNRLPSTYETEGFAEVIAGAAATYWVVDLQRLDREWLVDWNGLSRDEPDTREASLTFTTRRDAFERDYQDALIDRILSAFEDAEPRPQSVIIGAEMERHYAAVPSDWPAFTAFAHELTAALRGIEPSVRVAVGFNWSNFMTSVVPHFSDPGEGVTYRSVDRAWRAVIAPVYFPEPGVGDSASTPFDFYAFAAIPDVSRFSTPSAIPSSHFSGVQTYFSVHAAEELPVAWYAVGWPSTSTTSSFFGEYWETFVDTAGGVDVELVAWWGFSHLLESSDCATMTQSLGLSRQLCYRGLYTSSGAVIADLRDAYFGQ